MSVSGLEGASLSQEAPDLRVAFAECNSKRRDPFFTLESGDSCLSSRLVDDINRRGST